MKNFTLLITLILLNLGVSYGAGPTTGDCGCKDSDNSLKNGGFESGTNDWEKSDGTKFGTDTEYSECGSKNGLMEDPGLVYQEVDLAAGSKVTLSVYGGTHDISFTHTFKLTFYNGSTLIPITENGDNTVDMNYKVVEKHKLKQYNLSATAPAGATKVRFSLISTGNFFKVDVACMSIEAPVSNVDCCKDADNAIKNGSFEDGINFWEKGSTNFYAEDKYEMCGNNNGLINGSGSVYQDVNLVGGSRVDVSAYGGTHDTSKNHLFKLEFYNGNTLLTDGKAETNMDYHVTDSKLKKFTISSTAPAGATKVRFILYSEGDFFKVDVVCMAITPPPATPCTACADAETLLKNPSFESGTANWSKLDGTNFSTISKSYACGSNVGKIDGEGAVYQEVSLVPGSTVNLTVYGGTDNTSKTHQFLLFFYNSSNQVIGGAHNITVNVNNNVSGGLKQYSLPSTAPAGAVKVIFAAYSNGGKFYFDAACMSIVPPSQCETCTNNRLANSGFEDGNSNWSSEGNFATTGDSKNCGEKGAKLIGAGKFWQDITFQSAWGSQVSLTIWGAKDDNGGQKFQLFFYDASNKELGKIEKEITKIWGSAPIGLEKYTLAGNIPAGTVTIRIQASATSGVLRADGACLTFSGSPLPVILASFEVKKEGSAASLRWATTYESNSDHFDVQHSQDGKNWTNLATIQAQGESKALISYSYTHTSPFSVNLYRLKMVDLDETFAYSSIRSLNFNGDEEMKIYPNPTSDRIKLTSNQQVDNVKIYNQHGVLVLDTLPDSSNEVNLTKLVQGTYFVKINNGPLVRKILVVR